MWQYVVNKLKMVTTKNTTAIVRFLVLVGLLYMNVGDVSAKVQESRSKNPSIGGFSTLITFQSRAHQTSIKSPRNILLSLRGGEENSITDDEERYSRQVYTLGARAHSLVRKSSIIVDGPLSSGLLYEAVKNLALSGVGKIIILTKSDSQSEKSQHDQVCAIDSEKERIYFDSSYDDLGIVYKRGARAECFPEKDSNEFVEELEILLEYVKRLNPNVDIQTMTREAFFGLVESNPSSSEQLDAIGDNPVFLSVERPQSSQIILNDLCRKGDIPFVGVETASVYGRLFCDFGDNFYVIDEDGETPKTTLLSKIEQNFDEDSKKKSDITIHCVEGEHHDVSMGDTIEFQWVSDESECLKKICCDVVFVNSPICITARVNMDEDGESISKKDFIRSANENAKSFSRIKVPKKLRFMPLSKALKQVGNPHCTIFAASDLDKSFDLSRRFAVMSSFHTLDKFVEYYGRVPQPSSEEYHDDLELFHKLMESNESRSSDIVSTFAKFSRAKFMPIQGVFGALCAQEVLKAASGLYNPIEQFLLYDCDEVVVEKAVKNWKGAKANMNAAGMKYLLGKKFVKKLSSQKIFVVGSGAIGCELLKNLAAIEAGTYKKKGGQIILTDMDTIEKSNLSRQLLFRDADVGKFKSEAAQEAVFRMNPRITMDIHTSKVGDDSKKESYFNDEFWSKKVDIVINALDNVEARLYMDSKCIANRKAMIDAGTLGAKGNVQVVVPFQSESYGSSVDPPEPTIAVCTLKNFPYEISHTIQWGKDLFDGLFNRRPCQVNEYSQALSSTSEIEVAKRLIRKFGEETAQNAVVELTEDCTVYDSSESLKKASIIWAVKLARNLFHDAIIDLLKKHPIDSVDEDGEPFWSGTRRTPTPLQYSHNDEDLSETKKNVNQNLIDFVVFAARLRIENYIMQYDCEEISSRVSEEEAKAALLSSNTTEDHAMSSKKSFSTVTTLAERLEGPKKAAIHCSDLTITEFEKDDDSNGHVAFVTAASNLRAICYQITPTDRMETRRVAGRIVPAMVTTTALVSALQTIELVKLLQKAPLRSHKNAFVNLALPFFAFTSPLPAEQMSGIHGSKYTIWDRIVIKEGEKNQRKGGITLKTFINRIKKKLPYQELEVSNVSFGPFMLFANFLHDGDKEMLEKPIIELIKEAVESNDESEFDDDRDKSSFDTEAVKIEMEALKRRSFIDFSVLVEDSETGEEGELPPIRIQFHSE